MNYINEYKKWCNHTKLDKSLLNELNHLQDEDIKSRFNNSLSFGTAGIRGLLGAGTNRMNVHTVAWATQGLTNCLLKRKSEELSVVIGYDVRYMSKEFAEVAAAVLAVSGIQVHLFPHITPTPLVSYGVRELKADAGIMITASHNPKEYNGYKVYGEDGAQIVGNLANDIANELETINVLDIDILDFNDYINKEIKYVDKKIVEDYQDEILKVSFQKNVDKDISIVFTPLNGTGLMIEEVLMKKEYTNIITVEEERNPDPEFDTTKSPNPENPTVFRLAEKIGKLHKADILLATDPDADRIGVEVLHKDEYVFLTGNQIGMLLVNYILEKDIPENAVIVKTIVTSKLVNKLAKNKNVEVIDVLVGFKNIYELVKQWETTKEYNFVMGFEESLGFGLATFVRDKDAILAASIIAEMAAYYKKQNKDLIDVLEEIYDEFGYIEEETFSITLNTLNGQSLIKDIMDDFRNNPVNTINNLELIETIDYLNDDTSLPKDNTIVFKYSNDNWFAVRPSGTEPKMKFYVYGYGKTINEAKLNTKEIKSVIDERINEMKNVK